jgi:hypothetical protein
MLGFLIREDSHPPIFYLVERAWVAVVGSSDLAVAALGLIPGVLLIPVAAAIAWRWSGPLGGALAAWFIALAWPAVWHAGDGRPYAFLSLCTLLTAAAGFTAVRRSGAAWSAYALGSLVLLYTHGWWVLVVAGLALATGWAAWRSAGMSRAWVRAWLLTHAVIALGYLPWLPVLIGQGRNAGYASYDTFPVQWLVVTAVLLLGVTLSLLLPAMLILAIGLGRSGPRPPAPDSARFLILVVAIPCVLALAAWKLSDLTVSHCVAALTPLALLALACVLGRAGRPGTARRRLGTAVAFITILGAGLASRWSEKSNVREAARFVAARAGAEDLVIVYPSSIGPVYQRYHASPHRVAVFPPQEPVVPTRFGGWWGRFDDPNALAQTLVTIEEARRERRTVWLVTQMRLDRAPDSTAPIGTRERFRHGVGARVGQIRSKLNSEFGDPDPGSGFRPVKWARELVQVERYTVEALPVSSR